MQQEQTPKEKNIPNKMCPVPTSSPVGATLSQSPGQGHCAGLTATSPSLPQGSCWGVTAACARCELSQPVTTRQLVKSPWSFLLPKKKGIPIHGWGRRRRQHNCLSSGESHCAYFHLSVTYAGTALQVEIEPLLLG